MPAPAGSRSTASHKRSPSRSSVISQSRGHGGWFAVIALPIARRMNDAATRLAHVHDQIARAAKTARRKADDIALIAVTKQRTVVEIEALIEAGVTDFGENRVQEAEEKWPLLLRRNPNLRLHMIGQLQSNKAE